MYEAFYGFRERPFDLTPNPRFLLLTGKHREALSNLQYGLTSRRGSRCSIGDAGTGQDDADPRRHPGLREAGRGDRVPEQPDPHRAGVLRVPHAGVRPERQGRGVESRAAQRARPDARSPSGGGADDRAGHRRSAGLPDELLEEVRLLANIETTTDKLLPIVLAGQPELADRLNQVSLRQLKQRVALRCLLLALDAKETAEYIAGRIRVAGGNSVMVFTRQAVDSIYDRSGGIPRLISVICDNALISGFAADRRPVGRDIVEDVCRDFDLGSKAPTIAPAKTAAAAPHARSSHGVPVPRHARRRRATAGRSPRRRRRSRRHSRGACSSISTSSGGFRFSESQAPRRHSVVQTRSLNHVEN